MNARTNLLASIFGASTLLLAMPLAAVPLAQSQTSSTSPASATESAAPASPTAAPAAQAPALATEAALAATPRRVGAPMTLAEGEKQAWTMLRDAAASSKPDTRIQAVSALSTLAGSSEAKKIVAAAFADKDFDVRAAAVVAVQTAKDRSMIPELRKALDDPSPEVSFAAATALWRMGNDSGKDILVAVLDGERKAAAGFMSSNMHTANKDMHSPATLAAIGAKQGAYMLLGPFGVGLDALDYVRKGNTGNSARVLAVALLSEKKSDATRDQLVAAVGDKDPFVRLAAARALGDYHTKAVTDTLLDQFGDSRGAVRLMAAASYLRATGSSASRAIGRSAKLPAKSAH